MYEPGVKQVSRCLFRLSFALALMAGPICAQVLYGTLTGIVTDPTTDVVPNAEIKAQNTQTNVVQTATTNEASSYSLTTRRVSHLEARAAGVVLT